MNHTVIAVKWLTSTDLAVDRSLPTPTVVDVVKSDLRTTIEELLFDRGHNQCLLRWENNLYVCDKSDTSNRIFSRTIVNYHPYMNYLD